MARVTIDLVDKLVAVIQSQLEQSQQGQLQVGEIMIRQIPYNGTIIVRVELHRELTDTE